VNTELAGAALSARGRRLAALGPAEVEGGLVRDVTEVLTSFCARLYGRRPARGRAGKALRCAARGAGPASPEVSG
jgi:putative resolvase